jgi:broad specificity phosphatase PhoE
MLYLARHGETDWNAAGRYQGAKDSPLTAVGRRQAASLGRLLATLWDGSAGPLRAYVSPLGRARETAAIIGRHLPLEIQLEPRIAEVSLGPWDGLTDYEIEVEYPGALNGAGPSDWYFRAPGGERLGAVKARVSGWLDDVRGPALAISHGLAGRIIRGVRLGLGDREMLGLPVPQDGLYALSGRRAEFLAAPS